MTNQVTKRVKFLDPYLRELSMGCPNRTILSWQATAPLQEQVYGVVPTPLYRQLYRQCRTQVYMSVYRWGATS